MSWEKYNCDQGNRTVLAKLKWSQPDIKNRANWPRGTVLEPANQGNREVLVQIKFLIDNAPHHALVTGNTFVFFDKSAEGVVITPDELRSREGS